MVYTTFFFLCLYRKPLWLWLHFQRKKMKSILDKVVLGRRAETIWHVSWFTVKKYAWPVILDELFYNFGGLLVSLPWVYFLEPLFQQTSKVFFLSTSVLQGSAFSGLVLCAIKWILQGELFREYLVGYPKVKTHKRFVDEQ